RTTEPQGLGRDDELIPPRGLKSLAPPMQHRPKLRSLDSVLTAGLHQPGGDNDFASDGASNILPLGNAASIKDEVRDLPSPCSAVSAHTRFVVLRTAHGACRFEMRAQHQS